MQTTKSLFPRLRTRAGRRPEQMVSNGRVACPRSAAGDVDLDRCFSCPLLGDMRVDEAGREWVSCRPAPHMVTAAELRAI